jgi:hypothetical protein
MNQLQDRGKAMEEVPADRVGRVATVNRPDGGSRHDAAQRALHRWAAWETVPLLARFHLRRNNLGARQIVPELLACFWSTARAFATPRGSAAQKAF